MDMSETIDETPREKLYREALEAVVAAIDDGKSQVLCDEAHAAHDIAARAVAAPAQPVRGQGEAAELEQGAMLPGWLVLVHRDTDPWEVYPFVNEGEARAFEDRAGEQWSGVYLVRILKGPRDEVSVLGRKPCRNYCGRAGCGKPCTSVASEKHRNEHCRCVDHPRKTITPTPSPTPPAAQPEVPNRSHPPIDHLDAERMVVQLAGVSVAAFGCVSGPNLAAQGMYGWSVAYQDVVDLRRKYDALGKALATRDADFARWLDHMASVHGAKSDEAAADDYRGEAARLAGDMHGHTYGVAVATPAQETPNGK